YSRKEGLRGIRLTLGRGITSEDTEWTAIVLKQILNRLLTATIDFSDTLIR
ncbi:MAG: cysteine desulfurase, partial [cyanobacterium endosymbiont of Rhopalodia fuxianensis]